MREILFILFILSFLKACNLPRINPVQEVYADFTVNNNGCIAPCDVDFNVDSSKNVKRFTWDFGEGNGITGEGDSISHRYIHAGTFQVKLYAEGHYGQIDTAEKRVSILEDTVLTALFSISPLSCNAVAPVDVRVNNLSKNAIDCSWDWGDRSLPKPCSSLTHLYTEGGSYTITLTVFGIEGRTKTFSQELEILSPFKDDKTIETSGGNIVENILEVEENKYLIGYTSEKGLGVSSARNVYMRTVNKLGETIGMENNYSSPKQDVLYDYILTSDNRICWLGDTEGASDMDILLQFTDKAGNALNQLSPLNLKSTDNHMRGVIETQNGNFALWGRLKYGECPSNTPPYPVYQYCLVLVNSHGNLLDTFYYGDMSSLCNSYFGSDIVEDNLGFIVCGDHNNQASDGRDGSLFRIRKSDYEIDPSFSPTFRMTGNQWFHKIIKTSDGGYALVGYNSEDSSGKSGLWVVKVNASGIPLWQHTYGGPEKDEGLGILEVSDGGLVAFGKKGSEGWLLKLKNSDGDIEWEKTYDWPGESLTISGITQTDDCGFIMIGTAKNANWDKDIIFFKTDKYGNIN